jgi:hypothetical protein
MTKPVFLELVEKVTVVPTLMQNALLALTSGIVGFAVAEPPLRLISIVQGEEAEPQVFTSAQMLAGLDAEQSTFLTFFLVSWPMMKLVRRSGNTNTLKAAARLR